MRFAKSQESSLSNLSDTARTPVTPLTPKAPPETTVKPPPATLGPLQAGAGVLKKQNESSLNRPSNLNANGGGQSRVSFSDEKLLKTGDKSKRNFYSKRFSQLNYSNDVGDENVINGNGSAVQATPILDSVTILNDVDKNEEEEIRCSSPEESSSILDKRRQEEQVVIERHHRIDSIETGAEDDFDDDELDDDENEDDSSGASCWLYETRL